MSDSETLRIELDEDTAKLLSQLPTQYASALLSRAVDPAGSGPCTITAADIRRIAETEEQAAPIAPGPDDRTGQDNKADEPSAQGRRLLILGPSVLLASVVTLGAFLIPSVVHNDTVRVLIVIAMVALGVVLIGAVGLVNARFAPGPTAPRSGGPDSTSPSPASYPWTRGGSDGAARDGRASAISGPRTTRAPDEDGRPGPDLSEVRSAMRLGWYMAEVRGRNRPDAPPGEKRGLPGPRGLALPLATERSATESRVEAQWVLRALASRLGVDIDPSDGSSFSDAVDAKAEALVQATAGSDPARYGEGLQDLQDLIYRFDAQIQDSLVTRSDAVAGGYQLGRALAESYWALDPSLPEKADNPAAWWFLLGSKRCDEIGLLLGFLSGYFHPDTASAIAGSVAVWRHIAADQTWRNSAHVDLYRQIRRWYGLVILGQDPATLVRPYPRLKGLRVAWLAREFWIQLALTVVSAVALAGFANLVASSSADSVAESLLAVLGVGGLLAAALSAKVKNDTQGVLSRFRQDARTDLIAVAITTALPPPSSPVRRDGHSAVISRLVQERHLTPVMRDRGL